MVNITLGDIETYLNVEENLENEVFTEKWYESYEKQLGSTNNL